jgi:hypothetical protein
MDVNMNLSEILKNAFIFPSKNLETLSVYAILSLLYVAFIFEGVVTCIFGIFDIVNLVVGIAYIVIGIILWLITRRISIQCIKTGMDLEEKMPDFNWWQSFGAGISKVIITIYYFIIPAIIVVVIALFTNVIGGSVTLGQVIYTQAPAFIIGSTSASDAIYGAAFPIILSSAITISLGLIIFLVFSFFQTMGEARLAHTGSLKKALNIVGAARDIERIGVVRVFILSALIFVIVVIIEAILAIIFDHFLILSILTIITTPYLSLFGQRALGLLYSDIV